MVTMFGIVGFLLILTVSISMMMPMVAVGMTLAQPIDCTLGADCFIQNYVDLDSGKEWKDYQCGPLSYDGHKGTDFRLRNLAQMHQGVKVLVALDGTVSSVRDGMPDRSIRAHDAIDINTKECGNGVVITHSGGMQTQYCHMKHGSVAVAKGQKVRKGNILGLVGLSGQTEFPHLHFELRKKDGTIIDPFSGTLPDATCGSNAPSRWQENVKSALRYIPTAILSHGFAARVITADQAGEGVDEPAMLPLDADMILFWVDTMGLRDGDTLTMQLIGPDGRQLVDHSTRIQGNKAHWFQYIGKKRIEAQWPEGTYVGYYRVTRYDAESKRQVILDQQFQIDIIEQNSKIAENSR